MKKRLWASAVITLCFLLLTGFTLPFWMPKTLEYYSSKTALPIHISKARWSREGLHIESLQLSSPNLELLMQGIIIRWHNWDSGPQLSLIAGPSSIKLKRQKESYPPTAKPAVSQLSSSLDLPSSQGFSKALDFSPIASLFNRVPFIEIPSLKIHIDNSYPVWAFVQLSASGSVNAFDFNNAFSANNLLIKLALLSQPVSPASLKSLKQSQGHSNEAVSLEQPLPLLYGSLILNTDTRHWTAKTQLFLSSIHRWLMSAPTETSVKIQSLLEQIIDIEGTASLDLRGEIQEGQHQEPKLVVFPLQGKLAMNGSLELAATESANSSQLIHTQHQFTLSWPFDFNTHRHTGPIHIGLLGQRQTAIGPDEPWPKTWSLDLNIPKLESLDTQVSGSTMIEAQISGKYWESHLNLQIPKLICQTERFKQALFLGQPLKVDDFNCQLSLKAQLTSESQHPDLMGTAKSQIDGNLTLHQQRLRLLLKQASIEAQDISYPQGSTKRIAVHAAPFEINSHLANTHQSQPSDQDSPSDNNQQMIELTGQLQSVVQQASYQSTLNQSTLNQSNINQSNVNRKAAASASDPIAVSAKLNLNILPKHRPQQSSNSNAPLQHAVNIRLNLLDALTFTGAANLTLPQSQQASFSLSNLILEQQPMTASELQPLLTQLNQIPKGVQLIAGSIRTQFFAQELLDAKAPIEISVNIDDISIQQEQQSLQGLTANLLLKGSQSQLLSQGINENSFHIKRINSGIPLDDLKANLFMEVHPQADPPFQLTLNQIGLSALGGTANIEHLQVWPLTQTSGVLELNNLNLAEIVTLQSQPGISASGRLRGRLPFGFDSSGAFFIKKGTLVATPTGGYISVKDNPSAEAFKSGNPQLKQAFEALEYLQFQTLTSETSMSAAGDLVFKARIEGKNPQQKNNRPIVFNYTHEENLYLLLKSLLIGDQMAKEVENTFN